MQLSSDDQLAYVVMRDGIVVILAASDLGPRLEIDPSVYLPPTFSMQLYSCTCGPNGIFQKSPPLCAATNYIYNLICSCSSRVNPTVIATYPQKPNQFALGLSDGGVVIIDSPEPKGIWILFPPVQNGFAY